MSSQLKIVTHYPEPDEQLVPFTNIDDLRRVVNYCLWSGCSVIGYDSMPNTFTIRSPELDEVTTLTLLEDGQT